MLPAINRPSLYHELSGQLPVIRNVTNGCVIYNITVLHNRNKFYLCYLAFYIKLKHSGPVVKLMFLFSYS